MKGLCHPPPNTVIFVIFCIDVQFLADALEVSQESRVFATMLSQTFHSWESNWSFYRIHGLGHSAPLAPILVYMFGIAVSFLGDQLVVVQE